MKKIIAKISNEGILPPLRRRLNWYWVQLRINNHTVGKIVERLGNYVVLDRLWFSLDCPLISTPHKSTILFGLHEIEERRLTKNWISSDLPVVEFGGGLGVVSCLTSRILSDHIPHIVVEANPAMIPALNRNRALNGCDFRILNAALGYDAEFVFLNIDEEFVGSSLREKNKGETVKVKSTSLAHILDKEQIERVQIICDIEGLESDLIRREILHDKRVEALLVEMHPQILGVDHVGSLFKELLDDGFALRETIGDVSYFERK